MNDMISNSSKYAIKAVLFLGLYSDEKTKVMAKDIAGPIKAPQPYISKILQELSRHQIISSMKGPKGGFYLSQENKKQFLINIVTTIEGENRIHTCVLGLEKCDLERPCPLHHVVYPTKFQLLEYLSNETIESFTEKYETGHSYFSI